MSSHHLLYPLLLCSLKVKVGTHGPTAASTKAAGCPAKNTDGVNTAGQVELPI